MSYQYGQSQFGQAGDYIRGNLPDSQGLIPIESEASVAVARVPYFVDFTPDADIAAGATVEVNYVHGYRNFIVTEIGATGPSIGLVAGPCRFKISISDLGASRNFQPHRWDATAWVGGNFGTGDNASRKMPVPWRVLEKHTIQIVIENISAIAFTPTILLSGYLEPEREYRKVVQQITEAGLQI